MMSSASAASNHQRRLNIGEAILPRHANASATSSATTTDGTRLPRRRRKRYSPFSFSSSYPAASSPTPTLILLGTVFVVGLYLVVTVRQVLELDAATNNNDGGASHNFLASLSSEVTFLRRFSGRRRTNTAIGGPLGFKRNDDMNGKPFPRPKLIDEPTEEERGPAAADWTNSDSANDVPPPLASWSHPVIHVVNTRFMQGQANLHHLAEARLVLFQHFCLPTMVRQSVYNFTNFDPSGASNLDAAGTEGEEGLDDDYLYDDPPFLWIIKVDPQLDSAILSKMVELVGSHVNIYLVGSHVNYGIGIKAGGWRGGQAGRDVLENAKAGRLYSGEVGLLRRAHEMRRDRIVLETRLDADDGLNILFLERLQRDALQLLTAGFGEGEYAAIGMEERGRRAASAASHPLALAHGPPEKHAVPRQADRQVPHPPVAPGRARWIYWCALNHVAWDPNPPEVANNPNATTYGTFVPWKSPRGCITAGLTVGASVGIDEIDVPRFPHQTILERIRIDPNGVKVGGGGGGNKTGGASGAMAEPDQGQCGLPNRSDCLRMVDHPKMGALRSRTPTSAGMHGVFTDERKKPVAHAVMEERARDPKVRRSMWKVLLHYFAVTEEIAAEVNKYVADHFVDIVRDNLRGQCTRGHSCKVSSKEELQRLLDVAGRGTVRGKDTVEVTGAGSR